MIAQFPNLVCLRLRLWPYEAAGIAPRGNIVGVLMVKSVLENFLSKVGTFGGPGLILDDLNDTSGLYHVEHLEAGREALRDGLRALGLLEPAFTTIGYWCHDEQFFRSWYPRAGIDMSQIFGSEHISIDKFTERAARANDLLALKIRAARQAIERIGGAS